MHSFQTYIAEQEGQQTNFWNVGDLARAEQAACLVFGRLEINDDGRDGTCFARVLKNIAKNAKRTFIAASDNLNRP